MLLPRTVLGMRPGLATALIVLCVMALASIGSAFVPRSVHARAAATLHSLLPSYSAGEPREDLVIIFKQVLFVHKLWDLKASSVTYGKAVPGLDTENISMQNPCQ